MRVGVFVDTPDLRGWRRAVFKRLLQARDAQIALIIIGHRPRTEGVLWRAVDAIERALAKRLLHGPLARARGFDATILDDLACDISDDTPQVFLPDTDVIKTAKLDVIVDLSTGGGVGADLASRGVWRIASREGARDALSPLGFWEFFRGQPVTTIVVLARVDEEEEERQIASGSYSGFMWSWSLNDWLLGLRSAALLEGALRREGKPQTFAPTGPQKRSTLQAPLALFRTHLRLAADAFERATSDDRWRLLLSLGDPRSAGDPIVIEPPKHSYWADPFVVMRDGRCHIFFEEYLYAERRGVISHVCIDNPMPGKTLRDLKSTIIFDEPHHLSYPFLFEHRGELFMIPESSGARTVEIWQSTNFPHGWTRVAVPLKDVTAADTSLLEWNGKWWLFTNLDRSGVNDHRSELHVFYADHPIIGAWTPHPLNPVVIDAECGRMAGGFLTGADGRPIRCGQKQGRRYGEEVSYRLITELTETSYAEEEVAGIAPIPVAPGARTHHICARDGMIVADECFVVPKWKRRRFRRAAH